ncbi:MAG: permease-like cell division protein FtsX [Actinomycetota bacterium]|nr:permease-like cell division protein FtsX [Actinomycetota bacterium]
MGPRWRYLSNEAVIGLRRNLLMTLATVVTVTVSLALLGAGLLTQSQVNKAQRLLFGQVEVSIFLEDTISEDQRRSLQGDLSEHPLVEETIYESKQKAFANAKEIFANEPEVIQALQPDDLPASFRVRMTDPEQFDVIASQFASYPGIEEVVDQREVLKRFFAIMRLVRTGALAVAGLQLIAAAALISNTIRITAFARREQTAIMKLVGATNWYIRLPFLIEGLVAGVVGALIAGGLLLLGDVLLLSRLKSEIRFFPFIDTGDVVLTIPLLVVAGAIVATLASWLSLRRFLDV